MSSLDITKHDTTLTQGLPQTGDPLPSGQPKPVEPPQAVTSPPSPTQPNFRPQPGPPGAGAASSVAMNHSAIRAQSRRHGGW
jgi:hypothetical protein